MPPQLLLDRSHPFLSMSTQLPPPTLNSQGLQSSHTFRCLRRMLPAFSAQGPTLSCLPARANNHCFLRPTINTPLPCNSTVTRRSRSRICAQLHPASSNPPQPPPPPGREDEFSDMNGDALEEQQSKSVATLDRDSERSFDTVLQELTAIQQDGPRNVAILGTRYTSYLHQQIIELLTYANVLVGNHVFTSGAGGTNAAVIRGALRAEKPELLTVVLPQSLHKQPKETQEQVGRHAVYFRA